MHIQLSISVVLLFIANVYSHGDEAESVSVADFKSSFISDAIVPEVLAAFNPSVQFYVGFEAADGDGALLMPGMNLTTEEAKSPFEFSVENIFNASKVTSSSRFIIYMIGPDVPSRSKPTSRNVRHFLGGNFTISTSNSSVLETATLLTNLSAATNEYAAPAPLPNTGAHRYVYLIYTQPTALDTKGFADLGFNASARTGFNLTAFRSLAGLGPSIGGTSFLIQTDDVSNSTSSTNPTPNATDTTKASGTMVAADPGKANSLAATVFVLVLSLGFLRLL